MIPLPPPDLGLGNMRVALDAGAMTRILREQLAPVRESRLELIGCLPTYIRYKPGTSCLVQYELRVREAADPASRVRTVQSHARFGQPERTAAIWERASFARLVERAARKDRRASWPHAVLLPGLDTILQSYPLDRDLPGLIRASSRRAAGRLLGHALGGPDAERVRLREVTLLRYRPGRKALLRYELDGGPRQTLYAKVFADERADWLFELGRRLTAAGIPTPQPVARLETVNGIVHRAAPGVPLAALDGVELAAALAPTGQLLGSLHAMSWSGPMPPSQPVHVPLAAAARTVALLLPDLAGRVERLGDRLGEALAVVEEPDRLIHGDFYDDQVLVDSSGIVVLDLDEARHGDPMSDIGNALAHLAARAPDPAAAEAAREALLEGYPGGRSIDPRRLALFESSAGLEMAVGPFRRLQPDWPEAVARLVGLAEERADLAFSARPIALSGQPSGTHVDAALPQLDELLDGSRMAVRLTAALGRPVERVQAAVVRHKPGRRCAVRYDMELSANGSPAAQLRLYGKAWARPRGARVHATLTTLAAVDGRGMPRLPRPVAYLPDLGLALVSEVRGLPVAPSLLVGERGLGEALADGLHALHVSGAQLDRQHSLADEMAPLADRTARLAGALPDVAPLARACLEAVERRAAEPWVWRRLPIHRDFYHDQVVIGPQGLGFLDLDDASMGEPAVDVANLLAHLRLLALQEPAADRHLLGVRHGFGRRSHDLDAALDARLVRFLEGATLLRLADIHQPRPDGDRIAAALLGCARLLLSQPDREKAS